MSTRVKRAEVVFGRGGVRGIALAGAAAAFEEAGYHLDRVAGVSAGAVVAALVAAGYAAREIRDVVRELDYAGMRDAAGLGRLPGIGPVIALFTRLGLYGGDTLLRVFQELLAEKGIRTFGDLRGGTSPGGWPLRIVAADLTRERIVVLPAAAADYGIDPDRLEVALALRLSTSVPIYFQPLQFGSDVARSLLVDGGLLLGIPFRLLEAGREPGRAVFGIQTRTRGGLLRPNGPIRGPLSLLGASYYTALAANETCNRSPADAERIIDIDCGAVRGVDFGIGETQKAMLYDAGYRATRTFLLARSRAEPVSTPEPGGRAGAVRFPDSRLPESAAFA